jgi:hypothetical protein
VLWTTGNTWKTNTTINFISPGLSGSSGLLRLPNTTVQNPNSLHKLYYNINYDAILNWIQNTGTNPFPPRLRAGGILYYNSIPTHIASPSGNMPTSTQDQKDQRFWKEYIDEVLGLQQYSNGSWAIITGYTGYGDDLPVNTNTASSSKTTPFPAASSTGNPRITFKPGSSSSIQPGSGVEYMDYRDNPPRPRLKYWFGPMTMVDHLGNYNMGHFNWPGTVHEAPMWQLKTGVQTAIDDVKKNHPNDYLTIIGFSIPMNSKPNNPSGVGYYNGVLSPLGQNYTQMTNALWFPPTVNSTKQEISYFDSAMSTIPHALSGTCSPMGFMLAYNQFSGDSGTASFTSPTGQAGGLGRNGAQRTIIFETDGVASATATNPGTVSSYAVNQGANKSYFPVRYRTTNPELPNYVYGPSSDAVQQTEDVVGVIVAQNTASPPGYATTRKPVLVHCIAFGSLFYSSNTSTAQSTALGLLENIQWQGGTQPTATTALPSYKIINQTSNADRITAMNQAFTSVMQDAVSVTLIR